MWTGCWLVWLFGLSFWWVEHNTPTIVPGCNAVLRGMGGSRRLFCALVTLALGLVAKQLIIFICDFGVMMVG